MYPVFIYALNDPTTGIVRYCGQTIGPDKRLKDHVRDALTKKWHVSHWVKKLLSKNLRPIVEILDVVPDNEADFWEREYIQNFLERGFDLTNGTDGGGGTRGRKHSPATVEKMSAAKKGTKRSLESCEKQRNSVSGEKNHFFGKNHRPETLAKISAARTGALPKESHPNFGKALPPEVRAKISATLLGRKLPPEVCEKMSASRLNKPRGPYKKKKVCSGS